MNKQLLFVKWGFRNPTWSKNLGPYSTSFSLRGNLTVPCKETKSMYRCQPHMETEPSCMERDWKELSKRSFIQFLVTNWCENSLLLSSFQSIRSSLNLMSDFMDNKMLLALNEFNWLIPLTKGLKHMDEATYTLIVQSISILLYYKSSHNVIFEKQCEFRLSSYNFALLVVIITYSLQSWTSSYIGGSCIKYLPHSYTYYFNWLDLRNQCDQLYHNERKSRVANDLS